MSQLTVYNSYQYNKREINEFLTILKNDGYNINIKRIRNEWKWHNIAYFFDIEERKTCSVDVYFNSDDEGHGIFSWIMNTFQWF